MMRFSSSSMLTDTCALMSALHQDLSGLTAQTASGRSDVTRAGSGGAVGGDLAGHQAGHLVDVVLDGLLHGVRIAAADRLDDRAMRAGGVLDQLIATGQGE